MVAKASTHHSTDLASVLQTAGVELTRVNERELTGRCPVHVRTIGREDLIPQQFDPSKEDELRSQLSQIFLTKSRDEWFELLTKADVPVGKVLDMDELFSDPQILHREMIIELNHPKVGKVKQIGIGIKLSDTPGAVRALAHRLGQDTSEVLSGLGYSQSEMKDLRQQGAIY